jgi:hypothetical protein
MSDLKACQKIMEDAGWTKVGYGAHFTYRCPCGQHTAGITGTQNRLAVVYARKAVRRCINHRGQS